MKFTNGFWLMKQDVQPCYPMEVRDARRTDAGLVVYVACNRIERRGDTLGHPMLTYTFSSPSPNAIRVRFCHHKGTARAPISFLKRDLPDLAEYELGEDRITVTSGDTQLVIERQNFALSFFYRGVPLTQSGARHGAYLKTPDGSYMREMLDIGVGESVYGLGERFTPLVKNGQAVDIWNEDGGTCSEQAYKNVPFYLSSAGYGVLVNNAGRVSLELGSEVVSRVSFSVPGELMDYVVFGGAEPKDALRHYTALTGRPPLVPAWSYGLWLTTSFTTSYDEQTVTSFVDKMAEYDIPLHTFHFDCFWMKEYCWCDFEWDAETFPDVGGMLDRLKQRGLKICVWINPYIGQKSKLFDEGMQKGYLLRRPNGDVWQWDLWQAGMGIVDFTNPEAAKWYCDKLQALIDAGVDCFKTDFGERIPTDVVYFDGSDPEQMHNYYTHLYNKAVYELLERNFGKNRAVLFARSATAGGQAFPVHWGGDCVSQYASMAETLRGGLSLACSGFAYWSHDISGFESMATPDLYKRWVAFGLLSSHSRLHGSTSYRVPWLFDEEAPSVLRHFVNLKCRLMPYLFAASVEAGAHGYPLMRAMILEFPRDPLCTALELQYMLGERLLVAPVFNERGEAGFYLPEGVWTDIQTNRVYRGRDYFSEHCDYFHLPLLARENTILPLGANKERPDYDYAEDVELHVFALTQSAECLVYDTDGREQLRVRAERAGGALRFGIDNPNRHRYSVVLRNIQEIGNTDMQTASTPFGVRLAPNPAIHAFEVRLV